MKKYTLFWDMHSGGDRKLSHALILLETDKDVDACEAFENHFGRDPYNVTCDCCGDDYSISEDESAEQALAYHMGWEWKDKEYVKIDTAYQTVQDFEKDGGVLIVRL